MLREMQLESPQRTSAKSNRLNSASHGDNKSKIVYLIQREFWQNQLFLRVDFLQDEQDKLFRKGRRNFREFEVLCE